LRSAVAAYGLEVVQVADVEEAVQQTAKQEGWAKAPGFRPDRGASFIRETNERGPRRRARS
jgi:hypothetical protein